MPDISEAPVPKEELELVYIAARMPEAETVRDLLDEEERENYTGLTEFRLHGGLGALFESKNYTGVGFYVRKAEAEATRALLRDRKLVKGIIEKPEDQG